MEGFPIIKGCYLDLGSGHTAIVVHQSSKSIYMPNFIEIEETFCGRTDVRTDGRIHGWTFETRSIRLTQKSRPKN